MKIIITDVLSYLFVHVLAIAMLMPPKGKHQCLLHEYRLLLFTSTQR